jgi:uncharacterized protein YacL (UPF0231 family)
MKNQKNKVLPEKINRYIIFGHWLNKELKLNDTDKTKVQELFHLNSSTEEQTSFYTKFHDEYKTTKMTIIKQDKKKKKDCKKLDTILQELTEQSDEETDFLWDATDFEL